MAIGTPTAETRRGRLAVEFALLFVAAPILMALVMPPDWLQGAFLGFVLVALVLLAMTPDFRWRELGRGWMTIDWLEMALVAMITAVVSAILVLWLIPGQLLRLPRRAPELWMMIMLLYPVLSALPQEVAFRLLFFRRYGALFPDERLALLASGATFALAHLVFWSPVTLAMTFAGGILFARAYLGRGGFAAAVVMHAICGLIVFTSGLGTFFYHGAIR